jgi:hypothetical protein
VLVLLVCAASDTRELKDRSDRASDEKRLIMEQTLALERDFARQSERLAAAKAVADSFEAQRADAERKWQAQWAAQRTRMEADFTAEIARLKRQRQVRR